MSRARRVDILYTYPEHYPYAILYFTGSKEFNVAMRKWALDHGYSLNEHGLTNMSTGEHVEGLATEKNIFDFLGLEYIEPTNRRDGTNIVPATIPSARKPITRQNIYNMLKKKAEASAPVPTPTREQLRAITMKRSQLKTADK
jgi:hypothetical protein